MLAFSELIHFCWKTPLEYAVPEYACKVFGRVLFVQDKWLIFNLWSL